VQGGDKMLTVVVKYHKFPFLFLLVPNWLVLKAVSGKSDKKQLPAAVYDHHEELAILLKSLPHGLLAMVEVNNFGITLRKV